MNFARTLIAAALVTIGGTAFAQASIDQNRALAGNVTPGDTAGFPVTISQPGSYKLTSNLYVPSGQVGVRITGPNVTLDLNGFSITGAASCTRSTATMVVTCTGIVPLADGVVVSSTGSGATVRRGLVTGFSYGVKAQASANIEDIFATQNGTGIHCVGNSVVCRMSAINAQINQDTGIEVISNAIATIERSISNFNGSGVHSQTETTVSLFNVQAIYNRISGISGNASGHAVHSNRNAQNQSQANFAPGFRSMGSNMNGITAF